jgi:hypothetical protein
MVLARIHAILQTVILTHGARPHGLISEGNLWQRERLRRKLQFAPNCRLQFPSHGCHASFPSQLPTPLN